MIFKENFSLQKLNTFGINAAAKYFASFSSVEALNEILEINTDKYLVLGGGSNILFTKNFDKVVSSFEVIVERYFNKLLILLIKTTVLRYYPR